MTIRELLLRIIVIIMSSKSYEDFKYALGKRESDNNYQCKNSLGYLGKYQFGMARLSDKALIPPDRPNGLTKRISSGYGNSSFEWVKPLSEGAFLTNGALQEEVFDLHVADYVKKIKKKYIDYIGTITNGVLITISGLVAGMHLAGLKGVEDFLYYGRISKDGYGTSVKDYISIFAGFNLEKVVRQK